MKMLVGVMGVVVLALAGCGSSGTSFSCLMGSGTSQLCIETTTNVSGAPNCGAGTQVSACPRTGADGACRFSITSGSASLTQTIWYYTGTSMSQEMSDCTNNGGVWLQP